MAKVEIELTRSQSALVLLSLETRERAIHEARTKHEHALVVVVEEHGKELKDGRLPPINLKTTNDGKVLLTWEEPDGDQPDDGAAGNAGAAPRQGD